ncbi:MAG: ribonuclease J [Butyricicoccus sp.]
MKEKLKIVPLGGLNEIGKNMTAIEFGQDIFVIDCGMAFPDNEMLGVDLVIPDITYLTRHRSKVRGIVITHGHEDHIGALPYVLKELRVPVYCTRLVAGILNSKFQEHRMTNQVDIRCVKAGDHIKLGCFDVELIHTNHSIADAVALAVTTPLGVIIHTGDFKIDPTPVSGEMIDLTRFGELGKKGVLALMSDSTNVERDGYTPSEIEVGRTFEAQFKGCEQRIIVATFASNIYRIQQILDAAANNGRKVAICGRSMENISKVAIDLGYLHIPENVLIDITEINRYAKSKVVIICTGSQGESMSALYRMAFSGHKFVEIGAGDKIILSASAIPGNEKSVTNIINELSKKGADVVYDRNAIIHVSGHACSAELRLMLSLIKPKYFIPVHGEYRMLRRHGELAQQTGIPAKNVLISEIGRPIEIGARGARLANPVPAGKVLVDGFGIGDVGTAVLRDRKHLSEDGLLVVVVTIDSESGLVIAGPDIVSRGFIYVKEAEDLMEELRMISERALDRCTDQNIRDWTSIKSAVKNDLSEFLYRKTKRSPMILPVIMEI